MSEFRVLQDKDEMRVLQEPVIPVSDKKKDFVLDELKKLTGLVGKLLSKKDPEAPVVNIPAPVVNIDIPKFVKIDPEQIKELSKKEVHVSGGGSSRNRMLNANNVAINPATEEKQDAIVTAIENIAIEAPVGGATEAKQDAIITALGNVKIDTGDIDLNTDGLEALQTATNTKLDSQITLETTLVSLTETLQELVARLNVLTGMANAGQPALRTIPIASVSTAVTGSLTTVTNLTNFGTGMPAREVSDDINNYTAIVANINNVIPAS
jgi:hypothetical protein